MKPALVTKVIVVVLVFAASFVMARKEIKNVLHFTAISGYNHKDGIRSGGMALDALAEKHGFTVKHSREVSEFSNLAQYDVVVFNNNTANGGFQSILRNKKDQQALVDYMEGGGLYIGYHSASDFDCTGWDWYYKTLYSGNCFRGHGGGTWTLEIDSQLVQDKQLSAMWKDANLGGTVTFETDKFRMRKGSDPSVRDDPAVTVMQKMVKADEDYNDHYFTWTKSIGKGRMIYTGLGKGEGDFTQNDNWLEKATWYWMKYLAGHYDEVASVDRVALSPPSVKITSEKISVLYPNPFKVRVLNVNGETVFAESGSGINEYSLSGLQAGLYFVKVVSEGNSVSQRILVH